MSEPTYQALFTVMQAVKPCRNLPVRHSVTGVQAVIALSEPTYHALCCRGAGFFSNVRTFLLGSVLECCRLLKWCRNLPAGLCVTVVQTI